MNHFYRVMVTKQFLGSTTEHREPPIQGKVIIKVTDVNTRGDFKLFVVNCDEDQHKMNSVLPGVLPISEEEAIRLAPLYQPERTVNRPMPGPMGEMVTPLSSPEGKVTYQRSMAQKMEKVTVPAVDLRKFYQQEKLPEKPTVPVGSTKPIGSTEPVVIDDPIPPKGVLE